MKQLHELGVISTDDLHSALEQLDAAGPMGGTEWLRNRVDEMEKRPTEEKRIYAGKSKTQGARRVTRDKRKRKRALQRQARRLARVG